MLEDAAKLCYKVNLRTLPTPLPIGLTSAGTSLYDRSPSMTKRTS